LKSIIALFHFFIGCLFLYLQQQTQKKKDCYEFQAMMKL